MKVTIEAESENEALLILNFRSYYCALFEIRERMRSHDKYDEKPPASWEQVRNEISEICAGINLDEIE